MSQPVRFETKFTVRSQYGLHARPAARFAQLASDFAGEIELSRSGGDEWVNGSSVLSILSLAAAQGTVLVIRAEGEGADVVVTSLGEILEAEDLS